MLSTGTVGLKRSLPASLASHIALARLNMSVPVLTPPCPGLQAFDDCTTISMTFKLLDSFEGLLDREVIAADLEKKHADLLYAYQSDLKVRGWNWFGA